MTARAVAWLRAVLSGWFWLQRDYTPALVASPARPQPARAHRAPAPPAVIRARILYLYHQADQPARDALWRAGWPAYT